MSAAVESLLETLAQHGERVALVQAGYRNRFGHPAPSVVQRYASHGIRLVDTVHCGAAVWRSDQPAAVDCERERAPRYWQHTPP